MGNESTALLVLMVGLPAAGKTSRARVIAADQHALRLTPDEWMIPLFGESDADGKRDVLEGRMITIALDLLCMGTNVVLDFGCWSKAEREALHWLVSAVGADFKVEYLAVDRAMQLSRVEQRQADTPQETFVMSVEELDRWREIFEAPSSCELKGAPPGIAPKPYANWLDWARKRWPALSVPAVVGRQEHS